MMTGSLTEKKERKEALNGIYICLTGKSLVGLSPGVAFKILKEFIGSLPVPLINHAQGNFALFLLTLTCYILTSIHKVMKSNTQHC